MRKFLRLVGALSLAFSLGLALAASADQAPIFGTVKSVDTAAGTLVVERTSEGKMRQVVIHMRPESKVVGVVPSQAGSKSATNEQPATFADVKPGRTVSVKTKHQGAVEVAEVVRVLHEKKSGACMRCVPVTAILVLLGLAEAHADDAPIVHIRDGRLEPAALSVHVGEVVRWRASGGQALRVELDRHPTAHEIAERAGEINAVFRKPGLHSYVVTIVATGERLVGTVSVGEAHGVPDRLLDCAAGSSDRVCFMP